MSKLKILYVITKSNWGGAQRYVYDLATSLSKESYDVSVVCGGTGPLVEKLNQASVKVHTIDGLARDVKVKEDILVFKQLVNLFRTEKPDVVHLNSSKIGGIGALAARITKVPRIIFTAHGWAFNENRSFVSKIMIKALYWITIMLSHITVTVSEATKLSIMNWPLVSNRVTVIRNGVRSEAGYSRTNARSILSRIHPGIQNVISKKTPTVWIGTIAELHHVKGHDLAIRAMYELVNSPRVKNLNKRIMYIVIGDGEERVRLEKLSNDLEIQDNIYFMGHIDKASEYMKAFDFFLLPSRSEALGYVLIEAGIAGLPVVATSVGGIPEIVSDMKSGILVQPEKSRDIYHALEFLMTHPGVARENAKTLHKVVAEEFSFEEMIERTSRLYPSSNIL